MKFSIPAFVVALLLVLVVSASFLVPAFSQSSSRAVDGVYGPRGAKIEMMPDGSIKISAATGKGIFVTGLPTSDPSKAGQLYTASNAVKVSAP